MNRLYEYDRKSEGGSGKYKLISWIQKRCMMCQRFLSKRQRKYCSKCRKEGRKEYKKGYDKEHREEINNYKRHWRLANNILGFAKRRS